MSEKGSDEKPESVLSVSIVLLLLAALFRMDSVACIFAFFRIILSYIQENLDFFKCCVYKLFKAVTRPPVSNYYRPDTLDPALLRPGRLDRKVEFGLPDLEGRTQIFKIHTKTMNCERDIRFELLARLCPNSTGKYLINI